MCAAGRQTRVRRGFSLVELVVAVLIIGMLASMAIPRLSRGAEGAGEAALAADLVVVRKAIVYYAIEHGNRFPGPTAADMVAQLTQFSDAAGNVSPLRTSAARFGPYLLRIPPLPIGKNAGSTGILIDTVHSPPRVHEPSGDDWVYNPNTGEFVPNIKDGPAVTPPIDGPDVFSID